MHGANSTPKSFNYIRDQLPRHVPQDIEYGHREPLSRIVDRIVARVATTEGVAPIHLIGHSLGGVVALAAAQRSSRIAKVATIAAPFGGSNVAALMRWLTPCQLFEDIHPGASVISAISRAAPVKNCLSIVTTAGGTTMIPEENDGVVSVSSQTSIRGPLYYKTACNHFECLLSDEVVDLLKDFIFDH